jgi:hypothetical protein
MSLMIHRLAASVLVLGVMLAPLPASAQLFGPSDEEKAREAAQDSGIQTLQGATQQQDARIRELEDRVRGLTDSLSRATGSNEELSHQLNCRTRRSTRMQKDFAYRLCTCRRSGWAPPIRIELRRGGTPSATVAPQSYSSMQQAPAPARHCLPLVRGISDGTIDATGNGALAAPPPRRTMARLCGAVRRVCWALCRWGLARPSHRRVRHRRNHRAGAARSMTRR